MAAGMVEQMDLGDHVCGFVDDPDDWFDVTARMVAAGLGAGQRVMLFVDRLTPEELVGGMEVRGMAAERAVQAEQLQIFPGREAYLPAGRFDPQGLLDSLVDHIERSAAAGYPALRLLGDMEWVLDEPDGIERLLWYETQISRLYTHVPALGICLYDRHRLPKGMERSVAGVHPAVAYDAADAMWPPQLRIRRTDRPYGLRLYGEVDISNRQALTAVLDAVLEEQPPRDGPIVVNVRSLRFADAATGAELARLALRSPTGVLVTGAHGVVGAVFDRLDLAEMPGLRITDEAGTVRGLGDATGTEIVA